MEKRKQYEVPRLTFILFRYEDVITTSGDIELPIIPAIPNLNAYLVSAEEP